MPLVWKLDLFGFFDPPERFDAQVFNIPAASSPPLQVVASLAKTAYRIKVDNGIGTEFIGFYKGAIGQEVLIGSTGSLGVSYIETNVARGSRISIRSLGPTVLTTGTLMTEFLADS